MIIFVTAVVIFVRIVIELLASVRYLPPSSVSPRPYIATGFLAFNYPPVSARSGWYIARSVSSPLASHWS